ncbi:MAG TPA: DHHA1 domain-containing protein [Halanaerobiales bacterium]|nr:DHHA1 domain-containing protein [Halanaerobiales bacterium]
MTEKLYYKDSFLRNFKADIVSYKEEKGEYHLVLNKTAFYPEGGGQPADKGSVASSKVKYVYEEKGEVYHIVDKLPEEKNNLDCKIDWQRRFDLMQQHTGQHVLSALIDDMYNAKTVGFHLGENHVTVDSDIELTDEELKEAEDKINEVIYKNENISSEFPGEEKLNDLSLRKAAVVDENIRIVKINGVDVIPCGGTHLKNTGQIGIISIIDQEKYKDGTRITFLCGKRALNDYNFKNDIITKARDILGVQNENINSEIERLKSELDDKEKNVEELKNELLDYRVEKLIKNSEKYNNYKLVNEVYEEGDYSDIRLMANKLVEYDDTIVIFGQKNNNTSRLILGKAANIEKLDMNEMIGEVMELLEGNGGGHEFFAQGGGSNPEKLAKAVELADKKIREEL